MQIPEIYAIAAAGVIVFPAIIYIIPRIIDYLATGLTKHVGYPNLVSRHKFLGPWTRADVLFVFSYIAANVCCLCVRYKSISDSGKRAATLSLVNMIPLFASFYQGFLDLRSYRRLHRSAGWMTFVLAVFHVIAVIWKPSLAWLSIGFAGASLCLIVLLCIPIFRRPSYEFFLFTHQILAIVFVYSIWRHLSSKTLLPQLCLYMCAGAFLLNYIIQFYLTLRHSSLVNWFPQAQLIKTRDAVRLKIHLRRAHTFKAGQYISLWIPSISIWPPSIGIWPFTQSHPFVVVSWASNKTDTLELLVEPRGGLTGQMAQLFTDFALSRVVILSGPHGRSVPLTDYETVIMIATGYGIAAHLPYLKQLVRGSATRDVRARRVHLIWQIQNLEIALDVQSLLNGDLEEDKSEENRILCISIYQDTKEERPRKKFGERATLYSGPAPLQEILSAELHGEHYRAEDDIDIEGLSPIEKDISGKSSIPAFRGGNMVITVSSSNQVRDSLQDIVRDHLDNTVEVIELDFQPSEV